VLGFTPTLGQSGVATKKLFADNGSYELGNVDGSPYLDRVNHDKLKKVLDM
jgi:hypothetical protein